MPGKACGKPGRISPSKGGQPQFTLRPTWLPCGNVGPFWSDLMIAKRKIRNRGTTTKEAIEKERKIPNFYSKAGRV